MCGRYTVFLPPDAMAALFRTSLPPPHWEPTWNLAPAQDAPVVRVHPGSQERRIDLLRWGLLPHWAKVVKFGRQPVNARAESVATAQMFRDAYAQRRCLVPADAFYEWQTVAGRKRAWVIARSDRQTMALAGLWDGWRGPDGTVVRTFAIVTTEANATLQPLHTRMPVVLEPADWPLWLGEAAGDPAMLMRPSAASFACWPVGSSVNSVRNDGPELLEPLPSGADAMAVPLFNTQMH
jgi:putative SOS response-associated peptidase YedK